MQTDIGANSKKRLYEALLFKDAINESFWGKFKSEGSTSVVQMKMDPMKMRGERVQVGFSPRLDIGGAVVNSDLEGNEDTIEFYHKDVILDQYRKAVRNDSVLQNIQAYFDLPAEIESHIKDWMTEYYDALHFKAIFDTTNANQVYAGGGSTLAGLTSSDTLGSELLTQLYALADTGKSREFTPLRPIKIKGKNYFVLLTHPDTIVDLRKDSNFRTALENAGVRGSGNALFEGADYIFNNILIYADRRCPINKTGSVPYAKGVLLGQQAIVTAMGRMPYLVRKTFDYEDEIGMAANLIMGAVAPDYNGSRYGSILVNMYRTNTSGTNNNAEINYSKIITSNQ